ncbi:hypothetical protein [Hydrocoleum sp. CS-953]|uniref:hypothetical protein n=1 Tax=Hydrocoleum sp. CS-953 TaxID=1671698 RepID=UPI00143D1CE9|nr:hypothetical protein [Hydrocoleum sp. CS-953]
MVPKDELPLRIAFLRKSCISLHWQRDRLSRAIYQAFFPPSRFSDSSYLSPLSLFLI